jgi:hypothetical protein
MDDIPLCDPAISLPVGHPGAADSPARCDRRRASIRAVRQAGFVDGGGGWMPFRWVGLCWVGNRRLPKW